jgi:hypothetical protein
VLVLVEQAAQDLFRRICHVPGPVAMTRGAGSCRARAIAIANGGRQRTLMDCCSQARLAAALAVRIASWLRDEGARAVPELAYWR